MEKSRSWSSARDWKSRNRQKRFEGSNPSFSARRNGATESVWQLSAVRIFSSSQFIAQLYF